MKHLEDFLRDWTAEATLATDVARRFTQSLTALVARSSTHRLRNVLVTVDALKDAIDAELERRKIEDNQEKSA